MHSRELTSSSDKRTVQPYRLREFEYTMLNQNFSSLEYDHRRDLLHAPMPKQYFINVKNESREKKPVIPPRTFRLLNYLGIRQQHLIIQFPLYYPSSGRLRIV